MIYTAKYSLRPLNIVQFYHFSPSVKCCPLCFFFLFFFFLILVNGPLFRLTYLHSHSIIKLIHNCRSYIPPTIFTHFFFIFLKTRVESNMDNILRTEGVADSNMIGGWIGPWKSEIKFIKFGILNCCHPQHHK